MTTDAPVETPTPHGEPPRHASPLLRPPGRGPGRRSRRRRRLALRRPDGRAARAVPRRRRGRPVAPRRRHRHRSGPADLAELDHVAGADRRSRRAPRPSCWCSARRGTSSTPPGVVDDGETTWLLTETPIALAAWLNRMKFMLRVEIADVTDDWAAIGEPVDAEGTPDEPVTWRDPWPTTAAGGTRYGPADDEHPGADRDWRLVLVPRDRLVEEVRAREAAGWPLVGTWASEAARVEAWRPRASPRGRPPDHPARARLAAHRRAPDTRAATAGRRRSPACTTSAGRRAAW